MSEWGEWSDWEVNWSMGIFIIPPFMLPTLSPYYYKIRYRFYEESDIYFPNEPIDSINVLCSMDTWKREVTSEASVEISGELGGETDGVSAKLGFNITKKITVKDTLGFKPLDCMNAKYSIYVRYKKIEVEVMTPSRILGLGVNTYKATIYKPVGLYNTVEPDRSPYCCSKKTSQLKQLLRNTDPQQNADEKRMAQSYLSLAIIALLSQDRQESLLNWRRAAITLNPLREWDTKINEVVAKLYELELNLIRAFSPVKINLGDSPFSATLTELHNQFEKREENIKKLITSGSLIDVPNELDNILLLCERIESVLKVAIKPEGPARSSRFQSILLDNEQRTLLYSSIQEIVTSWGIQNHMNFINSLSPRLKPAMGFPINPGMGSKELPATLQGEYPSHVNYSVSDKEIVGLTAVDSFTNDFENAAKDWERAAKTREEKAKRKKEEAAKDRNENKNGKAGDAEGLSADEENKASDNYKNAAKNWDKVAETADNDAKKIDAKEKAKNARKKSKDAKRRAAEAHERAADDHKNNGDLDKEARSSEKAAQEREELAEGQF